MEINGKGVKITDGNVSSFTSGILYSLVNEGEVNQRGSRPKDRVVFEEKETLYFAVRKANSKGEETNKVRVGYVGKKVNLDITALEEQVIGALKVYNSIVSSAGNSEDFNNFMDSLGSTSLNDYMDSSKSYKKIATAEGALPAKIYTETTDMGSDLVKRVTQSYQKFENPGDVRKTVYDNKLTSLNASLNSMSSTLVDYIDSLGSRKDDDEKLLEVRDMLSQIKKLGYENETLNSAYIKKAKDQIIGEEAVQDKANSFTDAIEDKNQKRAERYLSSLKSKIENMGELYSIDTKSLIGQFEAEYQKTFQETK